jgi:membrane associated rhomboid family serine protease
MPCIGASGAIAGVLGAYMITFPHARVITIIPIFIFLQIIELPAMVVLGFWFVIQFFNGTASISTSSTGGGVAWWAHIGGFVSGIIIFYIIRILFVKTSRNLMHR